MQPENETAQAFEALAGLATELADSQSDAGPSSDDALSSVLVAAARLAGADHASVTELGPGSPSTVAASDPTALELDAAQYAVDAGPCLNAAAAGVAITVDLDADDRWPEWRAQVLGSTTVRYAASHPLLSAVPARAAGSLNLYWSSTPTVDAGGIAAAVDLCRAALATMSVRATVEHLTIALESARTIGAALGVLMSQHRITLPAAFDLLRRHSQHSHRKLRDIADEVLLQGQLP